jgi:hypothetical protein
MNELPPDILHRIGNTTLLLQSNDGSSCRGYNCLQVRIVRALDRPKRRK